MSIQIPKPKKNGDKLLVRWLRLSTGDRWYVLAYLFLFVAIWLIGAYFAPQDVIEIGRLTGWGQALAALSMGVMSLVWNHLVVEGYVVDSVQSPSSLWLLLVWIGPAGVVYIIWLLHQETWPWERPLAWMRKKWEKRPRWLRRRRKERFMDDYEAMLAWKRLMAQKEAERKRLGEEEKNAEETEERPASKRTIKRRPGRPGAGGRRRRRRN